MAKVTAEVEVIETRDDLKKVKAQFDDLSRGGIGAMDKLQNRVLELKRSVAALYKELDTKKQMLAALTKEIDKNGFATLAQGNQLKNLLRQEKELAQELRNRTGSLKSVQMEHRNLGLAQRETLQQAQLLAGMFGVTLPASMAKLISQSRALTGTLGPILRGALVAGAAAVAGQALAHVAVFFITLTERVNGLRNAWSQAMDDFRRGATFFEVYTGSRRAAISAATDVANEKIIASGQRTVAMQRQTALSRLGVTGIEDYDFERRRRLELEHQIADIMREGVSGGQATFETKAAQQRAEAEIALRAQQREMEAAHIRWTDEQRSLGLATGLGNLRRWQQSPGGVFTRAGATLNIIGRQPSRAELDAQLAAARRIGDLSDAAQLAGMSPQGRRFGQIGMEVQRSEREMDDLMRQGLITFEQREMARVVITRRAEAERVEAVREFGRELESMYDRTIGSARTAGQAVANIWREVMGFVKRQMFDALAGFLTGGGRVGGGIFGGSFGGFGGFGGGFGGAGGALGPGGTAPYMGAFGPAAFINAALPGGLGTGDPASAATRSGGLKSVLSNLMDTPARGLLPLALGFGLGGMRGASQNPLLSAGLTFGGILGGFAGLGGIAGVIGGAGFGAGALAGMAALFANPVGLAIAGGLAAFMGIRAAFARGRAKRSASEVADQGFAEIRRIFDAYKSYRVDYGSAVGNMQQVWSDMVGQWQGMGGVGSRSISSQQGYFRQYLDQMAQIEQARGVRGNIIRGLPMVSFQHGGISGGGLAMLHPGEFVLNERAVQQLGVSLLSSLNTGGLRSGGGDFVTLQIERATYEQHAHEFERGFLAMIRLGGPGSRAVRKDR